MSFWNDKNLKQLMALNEKGLSASQIARQLGCSRNAVIGKLSRSGVQSKSVWVTSGHHISGVSRVPRVPRTPRERAPPYVPPPDLNEPESKRISLMEIHNGQCRWPHGDPQDKPDFHFCGHETREGFVYCEYHELKSRNPAATKQFRKAWGIADARKAA